MSWWSDATEWMSYGKNWAMFIIALATVAIGIAVAVWGTPFFGAVLGGALIGAGVSGLMASFSKETSWKDFGKGLGKGAIIGAVSGLFSFGASALISNVGLSGISKLLLSCTVRIGTAMASSFVTNGLNNIFNGKDFTENWKSALITGAIIGGIGAAAEFFRYAKGNALGNKLLNKAVGKMSELKDEFNKAVTGVLGKWCWVGYGVLDMGKVLVEGAAMQYITTGKIDWTMLCIGVLVYGGTRIARTVRNNMIENQQKRQDDKFAKEAFDDVESEEKQNIEDVKTRAKEKAAENLKQANNALKKDPENIEKQEAVRAAETRLQEIEDGKTFAPGKKHMSQCKAHLKDQNDHVTQGRNCKLRQQDGKLHNTENDLTNPFRDDLPKKWKMKEGVEYTHNGKTHVAKGGVAIMTDSEARNHYGNGYAKFDRGCAEPHATTLGDHHNQAKTDLTKSTMMPVGIKHLLDKNGMPVDTKYGLKRPCDACREIPFGKNFGLPNDLGEHIRRGNVCGEQTFMDVRRPQKKKDVETNNKNKEDDVKKEDDVDKRESSASRVSSEGKPLLDNEDYPVEYDDTDEEDLTQGTVCKKTGIRQLFKTSDDILDSLEEELRWQTALKRKCEKEKEEEERLQNDDFIRSNTIKKENIYATNSGRQPARAGTSRQPNDAYPAGQSFSKKKKKDDEEKTDETSWKFWKRGQNKETKTVRTNQRVVETFPIVVWSEKHNKYMMVDHNTWPKPIEGPTKLVAFLGVHKSGRTTLLHSLIYQAGYTMTKEQSLITKLPLGINMYILRELGLIFLDICDSMDMIGELQNDHTPIGNVLLETFGYMNCDHLLYSLPCGEETGMTKEKVIDYIKTRVELLFKVSNEMLNFTGAMKITLVPRLEFLESETCDKWAQLEQHFDEMQSRIEMVKQVDKRKDGTPLNDQERFGHLTEEDVLLGMKHQTAVLPVRFFQPGRSIADDGHYTRELKRLWNSVKDDTGFHPSSLGIEEMSETSVYGGMITTWNRVVENKDLTNCVTELSNEKTIEQARGEDGQPPAIEIYNKHLDAYLKQVPADSSLSRAFERYLKEREEASREFEKAPMDERDPSFAIRLLLKSGTILLKECLQMTDIQLKEKGLQIGLSVFSTLLGQGDKIMDIRLLRLGIIDLDLVNLLNDPLIYMHYHQAWIIFYFMATTGFRFHLLEVPLWDALQEILTRDDELTPEKLKLYNWSLHTLMAIMDLDEMPMLALERNTGRLDDDKVYLSSEQWILLDYDYCLYSDEHVQLMFIDTINNPSHASDNYEKLIKLAKDFYNGHDICKETGLLYDDLDVSYKDQLAHVTLNHFHKQCAGHFAVKLLNKRVMDVLKQRGKNGGLEVVLLILKLFRTATDVVTKDEKLTRLLAESGLPDWLLSTFLSDDDCAFTAYCHAASIASQIIFAQYSLKFGELPKEEVDRKEVHTLEHIRARERPENQVKQYGAYRLQLLNAGCHRVAVEKLQGFFDNGMANISEATKLLSFIIKLIISALDDEDRMDFVDLFLVQKRQTLMTQMEKLTIHCGGRVNLKEKDCAQLLTVETAMELVNRLIWSYYANDFSEFFGSQNGPLWEATSSILKTVYEKVIQARQTVEEELPENVEKRLDSLELEFVCLALNVSSISRITFTEVKNKLGNEKVATLGVLTDKNPRVEGSRPEILLIMDHLTKLKLEKSSYDSNNVQRAAYVINSSDKKVYNQFKGLVECTVKKAIKQKMHTEENKKRLEEAKKQREEKETLKETEDQKRLEVATARRKRLEALEKGVLAGSGPNDQPPSSSVKMACDGVYLSTSLLGEFSLPRKNWEDLLFGKLIEVYDLDASYGYMLLLTNNSNDGREKLEKFLQHLQKLLDTPNDQVLNVDAGETFLSLNWMPTVLAYLGYSHVSGSSGDFWLAPADILSRERAIIYTILEEFLPRQREIALKLDSTFREVKGVREATYGEQTLPHEFFSAADTTTLEKLKNKTVMELIKEKKDYAEWLKNEKFTYVLVRVEMSSHGERQVYQAVFNRFMTVAAVLKSLQNCGVGVTTLHMKSTDPPLDPSRRLEEIGLIALYIYCC